jgi:SAM-dependent methyltransferase
MQLASQNQISKTFDRILVPGAGLGRLAFDLYQQGYQVEANEISPVMVAAANAILQRNITGALHPFGLDYMSNEVDSSRRYDEINFLILIFPTPQPPPKLEVCHIRLVTWSVPTISPSPMPIPLEPSLLASSSTPPPTFTNTCK